MNLGKFEIETALGSGAFGTVYKAKDKGSGRVVAIKAVENHDPTTTAHEVSILRRIKHKFIIEYVESFYAEDGTLCIVMDFANRGTLETFRAPKKVTKKQPLGFTQSVSLDLDVYGQEFNIWRFISHMADALNHLHTFRPVHILHRDLKPVNILCKSDWDERINGNVLFWKIADFGIAKLLNKDAQGTYYATSLAGTSICMAPEVNILLVTKYQLEAMKSYFVLYQL